MKRALVIAALTMVAGCGTFEDPSIVIDLRPLAMVADPPEQLIPYDPSKPPDPTTIHLSAIEMCALIADPGAHRALDFTMTACPQQNDDRCDPSEPSFLIGGGTIDDPEDAPTPQPACARMEPNADLFAVVQQAVIDDPLNGFSSVDIQVVMAVNPQGGLPDTQVFASKAVVFGTQMPADRTPNHNPTLTELDWERSDTSTGPLVLGRCLDQLSPIEVAAGEQLHLTPVEPAGAREAYVVPTFDGGETHITENLSYDWLATGGDWSSASTGGPRDGFGNDPPLDTVWQAPAAAKIGDGLDLSLYVIQRDERGGQAWYESCVHVHP